MKPWQPLYKAITHTPWAGQQGKDPIMQQKGWVYTKGEGGKEIQDVNTAVLTLIHLGMRSWDTKIINYPKQDETANNQGS